MVARMRSALTGPVCAANIAARTSFWDMGTSELQQMTTRNR